MDNSNYYMLLDALTKASSQNTELLKDAERQLKCWETQPGFYPALLNIAADRNLDINIRWLSVLCTKNGVDCHWRNSISVEEKVIIKQKLLSCINEPVNQIALQLAVITSKVARHEFPKEWEELFPTLLSAIQSADQQYQLRALLTMHHVIKSLASKRLVIDRRIFQQLTTTIFSTIFHLWINLSKTFLEEVQRDITISCPILECAFLCLKILRKLAVHGFKDYSKETETVNFLSLIFQQIGPFLNCRSVVVNRGHIQDVCEKYLVLLIKILRDVLDMQPHSYIQFIQPTLECSVMYCFNKDFQDLLFERLIVQFLNLIKAILLCLEYKPSKWLEDSKNFSLTVEAHKIKTEFFTLPVLKEICQQLLSRYFLLSENDLQIWENNPEEFASEEGVESWKFNLRPCTETFFLSLFREFRDLLTPLIVEIIKNIQPNNTTDMMSILKKEAVYNAIGLSAFDLYDEIDFDTWFANVLIPELQIKINGYFVIRRRVIWLIGQWVAVRMSSDVKPLLYKVILQLLISEEDLVVRLTAANTLKFAVDVFEFDQEQFLPFLENFITSLFNLLREVKECDLKMSILHVLSFVIERMGSEVQPHVNSLMQYLPQLWDNCGDHNMLRCAIVSCFTRLVQCLRNLSESIQPALLPMIALCTDVSQPPHVYLLDDGLDLWWAIIENTTTCIPAFLDLASNLLALLEYNNESLRTCLQITDAYIVLCPENFLKRYGHDLVKVFLSIVTDLKSEGINLILRVVETVFIVFHEDGPLLFQPLLPFVLNLSLQDNELPKSLSIYFSLLSRVILHNQACFVNVLQEHANKMQKDVNTVLGELFDVWLENMPIMNPAVKRKLMALALTCLLTSGSEIVHDRICGIFLAVVEVLNDITNIDNDDPQSASTDMYMISIEDCHVEDVDIASDHNKRKGEIYEIGCQSYVSIAGEIIIRKTLLTLDPVHTVVLRNYFYNQVMALQQAVGPAKFEDLMSTVDVETMQQVKDYLKI